MKDMLKIQWLAVRGESKGGGSCRRLVLAPERERALKSFPSPPDVTETKANPAGFKHLAARANQL